MYRRAQPPLRARDGRALEGMKSGAADANKCLDRGAMNYENVERYGEPSTRGESSGSVVSLR